MALKETTKMLRAGPSQANEFNKNLFDLINDFLTRCDTKSTATDQHAAITNLHSIKNKLLEIFTIHTELKMKYATAKELLTILEIQLDKQDDDESVLQLIKTYQSQIFKPLADQLQDSPRHKLNAAKKLLVDLETININFTSESSNEALEYLLSQINPMLPSDSAPMFKKTHRRHPSVTPLILPIPTITLEDKSSSPKASPKKSPVSPESPPESPKKSPTSATSTASSKKSKKNSASAAAKPKSPKKSPRITISPSTSPRNNEQTNIKRKLKFDELESPRQLTPPRSESSPREKKPHNISPRSIASTPSPRNLHDSSSPKRTHFLSYFMIDSFSKEQLPQLVEQLKTETLESFYEKLNEINKSELIIPSFSGESTNHVAYSQAYGSKTTLTDGITFGDIHKKLYHLNESECLQMLEKLILNLKQFAHENKLKMPGFCIMMIFGERLYCINTGKHFAHLHLQITSKIETTILYNPLENKSYKMEKTGLYAHFNATLFNSTAQHLNFKYNNNAHHDTSCKINVFNLITSPEIKMIAVITKNPNSEKLLEKISRYGQLEIAKQITHQAFYEQCKNNVSTLVLKLSNADIEIKKDNKTATYMALFSGTNGQTLATAFNEILLQTIHQALAQIKVHSIGNLYTTDTNEETTGLTRRLSI